MNYNPQWAFFSADIELSNLCEEHCRMCPREQMTRGNGVMLPGAFHAIAKKLAPMGTRITFCGMGNPLSNPHWPDFVRSYRELGGTVAIVTHANSLTPEQRAKLLDVQPATLEISFPSADRKIFDRLCPNADFDEALQKVLDLEQHPERRFPIVMTAVKTKLNPDEAERSEEFWKQYGLVARAHCCHSRAGRLRDDELTDAAIVAGNGACGLFAIQSFVTWEGKLLACCHDFNGETVIGDLVSEPIEELCERKANLIRSGVRFKMCGSCDDCRQTKSTPTGDPPHSKKARSRFLRRWASE